MLKFIKITALKNYNILVTGYKGFIGGSLLSELKKNRPDKSSEILLFEKDDIDEYKQWKKNLEELVESSEIIFHIGADSNTLNHNVNEVMFYNFYFSKILFDFVGSSNNNFADYATSWMSKATLRLNNTLRFAARDAAYFNWVQPYQHHTGSPKEGVYVYSFA